MLFRSMPVTTNFGSQFNVITEAQIERQGALDFYDALRSVPGVTFQKKNIIGGQTSHSLYVRGRGASHPSPDINIYFDDVPRSGVLYGQALADGIAVYALGGMEVYKYPQPSRFGSGYAMINFIPKYMTKEGAEFKVGLAGGSYGTIAENLAFGLKKNSFDLYLAQSWLSTDGHVAHSSAEQQSYYLNTGYEISGHWSVRLMGNYVSAETNAPDNPLTGVRASIHRYDTETSLATLTFTNNYKNASGYIKGYYNSTNFYLVGENNGDATSKQSNDLYGLKLRETFSIWEGSEFIAGLDFDKLDLTNEQNNWATDTYRKWDFPDQTIISPYFAISQFFGQESAFHIIPSAGLRYYSHDVFADKTAPQGGLVVGYGNTDLNVNYARGVNYPSPVVLQNFLANTSMPSGFDTEKINPEIVDHYEIGLTHKMQYLTLSANYFYDKGKDRTRAYMYGTAPDETFFNSSVAKYKINGVELGMIVYPLQNLEFYAGATWLKAKATGDDGIERDILPYTPEFAFQAGVKWTFLENFMLSGDFQHISDMYAGTLARTSAPGGASNFPDLTSLNKLDDINVFNIHLGYMFVCDKLRIKEGKAYIGIDNVFDSDYAYAQEIDTATGEKAGYNMPGISFMIGVELTF